MSLADGILLAVIGLWTAWVIFAGLRRRRMGGGCCGGCAHCTRACAGRQSSKKVHGEKN